MSEKNGKKVSREVHFPVFTSRMLKIRARGAILKPLNGAVSGSTTSAMLRLQPVNYTYNGKGSNVKDVSSEVYLIKGLRGCLRHAAMEVSQQYGLNVCHTSDKKKDSKGNDLIPAGFHPNGTCTGDPCILFNIFGSRGVEGKIRVFSKPITSLRYKPAESIDHVQDVHIATENRVSLTFGRKPIQDFKERYFSGEFSFEIDVTKLDDGELRFLTLAAMNMNRLGRGYNAGYGKLDILDIQLVDRETTRKPVWNGNRFKIEEITVEKVVEDFAAIFAEIL
ncbi:MAG: RAMP superfamily CRISPR-associated protein [Candidatus Odinarchaeota archaeon]